MMCADRNPQARTPLDSRVRPDEPHAIMAGVGKLLKQAQRMQRGISEAQQRLASERIEVSHGGGAVKVTVNGHGDVVELALLPEFLSEDAVVVQATLLSALQEAAAKARKVHEDTMAQATAGFQLPGF